MSLGMCHLILGEGLHLLDNPDTAPRVLEENQYVEVEWNRE